VATRLLPTIESTLRSLLQARRPGRSIADREDLNELKLRYLREVDIFRDMTPQEMEWVKNTTEMVTVEAGRVIYGQDEETEVLYILKRGRVQLYRLTPDGKKLEIATLAPGTFFGEMPLIGERMHHTFAEAAEESLICIMRREDVERVIVKKPQVAMRMLEVLGDRLNATESQLEALAFRSVRVRLAGALLRLAQDGEVRATHQELSEMVGAYRETITKTLDEFQREGLVDLSRMRIGLRDRSSLEALSGGSTTG
jgi:CRP/FNR family cyclic AMP-dependent transcriptional regulator